MSSTTEHEHVAEGTKRRRSLVSLIGILGIVGGLVLIVGGTVAYATVSSQLAAEKIVVAEDASFLANSPVVDPFSAYAEAEIINHHALEASGGKTYAELDREDPLRATVMNASFLRTSLFTSVVAFGVSVFAVGLGILSALFGFALTRLDPKRA
jgi:ABC-type glycerol-3-phosphate transport system permease component